MPTIYQPVLKPEPIVDLNLAKEHGLSEGEYSRILELLGRPPTFTEIGMYSVMWSEHCSYKNSIAELKKLPRSGARLLVSAGEENAGLVDIGDGMAVAFKIESHNHPSAIEPYQGAATGVGGILRDIFSMGARPIAVLNSLRFGNLDEPKTRQLFKGVVKGIADYGNSFGVPTVGGEIYFEACYEKNPLVNAMAVGIVAHEKVAKAIARGAGNSVMIVGSSTGRDGIHGATFASVELSQESEAKRPAVQVGDPFTEKLLLEATLEAIATGYVVGVQDMGAAGITCSTVEMSARGGTGMRIDLGKVPLREKGMTPYEIMLSESQERMLFVVEKGREAEINSIFERWDLHAEVIGVVTDGSDVEITVGGGVQAKVNAESLVLGGGAPVYIRNAVEPNYLTQSRMFDDNTIPIPEDYNSVLLKLLADPTIASKRYVYEQYDSMVRSNTVESINADAAIVRIKGTQKGLALSVDCNARFVYLNPRRGGMIAVAEAARNVACTGAVPLAITNCLNFGNPNDPEIYYQFRECVAGIAEACRSLNTPVTGGNVSFYNESESGAVFPTPAIGMLGLIEDVRVVVGIGFKRVGDLIGVWRNNRGEIGGSRYISLVANTIAGESPTIDLGYERRLHEAVIRGIHDGFISSAHDVSEGGLAVAASEAVLSSPDGIGCSIHNIDYKTLDSSGTLRPDFELFGESQSQILISFPPSRLDEFYSISKRLRLRFSVVGEVTADSRIAIGKEINIHRQAAAEAYYRSIEARL